MCDKYHFGICICKGKPRCTKCNWFGNFAKDYDASKQVANCAKEKNVTTETMFYGCHFASIAQDKLVWFVDSALQQPHDLSRSLTNQS